MQDNAGKETLNREQVLALVVELYRTILCRAPAKEEVNSWVSAALKGVSALELLISFQKSKEFQDIKKLNMIIPPGHYYSPIVDPSTVKEYLIRERSSGKEHDPSGISIDANKMLELWNAWTSIVQTEKFQEHAREDSRRYSLDNGNFPYGDAAILRATIAFGKPKKIVEIGSGNSTACMLDTIEEYKLSTKITCIEPYPSRLNALCRDEDRERLTLIESPVQQVPLTTFSALESGDILFIDSTHVLKTGSDVHFEIFHILPVLKAGVLVHIHDCPYAFEYPDKWIFEDNRSWNEAYAIRAFLMYNYCFSVRFWSSYFCRKNRDLVRSIRPALMQKPGSGLWLVKTQ